MATMILDPLPSFVEPHYFETQQSGIMMSSWNDAWAKIELGTLFTKGSIFGAEMIHVEKF